MDTPGINLAAMLAPPPITGLECVLCIQPHPDDNEIGMGGTVAALARAGCQVHYLTVTTGEVGNLDPTATRQQTAAVRRAEAEAAGRHLGAAGFHFLPHADGTLADIPTLAVEIASIIQQVQPQAIFCPDPWLPYECHYDHVVCGRAAAYAFMKSSSPHAVQGGRPWQPGAIAFYFTHSPNTVIDISDTFEQKFEAIALHKSQINAETEAMYRVYFSMKAAQLAQDRPFQLGEGFKVLGPLHAHCFTDAINI